MRFLGANMHIHAQKKRKKKKKNISKVAANVASGI